jgi:hypothetical protein
MVGSYAEFTASSELAHTMAENAGTASARRAPEKILMVRPREIEARGHRDRSLLTTNGRQPSWNDQLHRPTA